jgi:23S rRNA (cytosine1962-C5)-methyltransferase
MFASDQYQLIDFGDGRRLEQFGPVRLDRPCLVVEGVPKSDPDAWMQADARFDRTSAEQGQWFSSRPLPERWTISHGPAVCELKRTAVGHLGVFPEQAANWDWIADRFREISQAAKVLNLFAYTGGSTLAAAASGAEVVHVDAARNTIAWARRNAELSGMADMPIRWIAEDALKFAKRERKRGNHYDAVILDPPSYGHGPRGEVWRLSNHLPQLLSICGELTAGRRRFMLLTCHTPGFDPARLADIMADTLGDTDQGTLTAQQLTIRSADGRDLPSGVVARWQSSV